MPQIDFFFNTEEKKELVTFLFENKFTLVQDINSESPTPFNINSLLEYFHNKNEYNQLYFLTNSARDIYDLCFRSFEKDGKTLHYISQRNGGPTIDYFEGRIINTGTEKAIVGSNIAHYSSYYTCDLNVKFEASEELKRHYLLITKFIKNSCKKIKLETRTYFIGQSTINDIQNGWKLQNIDEKYYKHLLNE